LLPQPKPVVAARLLPASQLVFTANVLHAARLLTHLVAMQLQLLSVQAPALLQLQATAAATPPFPPAATAATAVRSSVRQKWFRVAPVAAALLQPLFTPILPQRQWLQSMLQLLQLKHQLLLLHQHQHQPTDHSLE